VRLIAQQFNGLQNRIQQSRFRRYDIDHHQRAARLQHAHRFGHSRRHRWPVMSRVARDDQIEARVIERQLLSRAAPGRDLRVAACHRLALDDGEHLFGQVVGDHGRGAAAGERECGVAGSAAQIQRPRRLQPPRQGVEPIEVGAFGVHAAG